MLNVLDLFSGIGGLSQSLETWSRVVAYCDSCSWSQQMLLSRMLRGELPSAPIWTDVTTLRGGMLPEIDVITAGFPCQDISLAGLRKGLAGERSGLFWEVVRLAQETEAPIIFLENVWPGVRKFVPTIRNAFAGIGYEFRGGPIAARDVGAPHKRQRFFAVATNTNRLESRLAARRKEGKKGTQEIFPGVPVEARNVADACGERLQVRRAEFGFKQEKPFSTDYLEGNNWDEYASFFLRVDNGIPHRGHRLRALGNSVVPAQAKQAFKVLVGIK